MTDIRPVLDWHRRTPDTRAEARAAVVFVHGFTGDYVETWGCLPPLLMACRGLDSWDIASFGYASSLRPDLPGLWAADAPIEKLATLLRTVGTNGGLAGYRALALVAHSMGGLVAQRAIVDDPALAQRVSHLFLFATPSVGLHKARPFRFFKRQVDDLAAGGAFITDLRMRWQALPAQSRPRHLLAVAGERDEFVPDSSSLVPFPDAVRRVVPGDHLSLVKARRRDDLCVTLVESGLMGEAAPAGLWNSARMAVESGEFAQAVACLKSHADTLDDDALVSLALALEGLGEADEAVRLLERHRQAATDIMGTLAGRLKRRWLKEGRKADAERALDLYTQGLAAAEAAGDAAQAAYHGINRAFLLVVYRKDPAGAAAAARQVLAHCAQAADTYWNRATRGEAWLILGDRGQALDAYAAALALAPRPREIGSAYGQALCLAGMRGGQGFKDRLTTLFRGGPM